MASKRDINARQASELELVDLHGRMSTSDLASKVEKSVSTVRRDLADLAGRGLVMLAHGEVRSARSAGGHPLAFEDREGIAEVEKRAIARAVAGLIPAGDAVILDGGTTCFEVARALSGRPLTVVTNSLPTGAMLSRLTSVTMTFIGGQVFPQTGITYGRAALEQLGQVAASWLVMGCAGVCPDGIYNTNEPMVEMEQAMMARVGQGGKVILAVDHLKFGKKAPAPVGGLDLVDYLVTDDGVDDPTREWLDRLGRPAVLYAPREATGLQLRTGA